MFYFLNLYSYKDIVDKKGDVDLINISLIFFE